jgi:hypothetical protein
MEFSADLESIMPSEISKTQKVNTVQFHLQEVFKVAKLIESRVQVICTGAEEGMGKLVFNGYNVVCSDYEDFLVMHSGDDCTTL